MAPDQQLAGAAAASAAADMHDAVVRKTHGLAVAPGQRNSIVEIATGGPEITRRDVHTASSVNLQHRSSPAKGREPSLAQQASIRRSALKGKGRAQGLPPESSSGASSKPVLVCAPSIQRDMKRKSRSKVETDSPILPPLENFSIQDILAYIGPEADASIDAIAEICGRSKLSLADEHGSHRPPHATHMTLDNSIAEPPSSTRLEPVVEVTSEGSRSRSNTRHLKLANAFHDGEAVSSDAVAATSNVTSHAQTSVSTKRDSQNPGSPMPAPLLSQVLTWLRRTTARNEITSISSQDAHVVNSLRSILSDSGSIKS